MPLATTRSRYVLFAAGLTWAGAVAGRWSHAGESGLWWASGLGGLLAAVVLVGHLRRSTWILILLALAGTFSGMTSAARERAILEFESPSGRLAATVRLVADPRQGEYGWWALAVADPPQPGRPPAAPMLLTFESPPAQVAGEPGRVRGWRRSRTGRARGRPYSGVVEVDRFESVPDRSGPWWRVGNGVRRRALDQLRDRGPGRALLAGFLVGDTSGVGAADLEALRRTGLTHLVAVSGSNVALFLMMVMVAAGPLAAGPRRRAVVGLAALVVLVVATRWEGSVIRAAVMAGLVLAGRVGGWPLDPVTALGTTVILVVVTAGHLATDVGFTLSVLATLGVMVGARRMPPLVPGPAGTILGASLGAQVAVAPVILAVFGSMPLLAPLTNLAAVPVVGVTSAVGAVGVATGWEPIVALAAIGADFVLWVARLGSGWPQIGAVGFISAVALLLPAARPRLRPAVAIVAALIVALLLTASGRLTGPVAVIFDVGQGDSILIRSGSGRHLLVDGGPDPAVLEAKLSAYGVEVLDLVVLSHVHADHATGLEAVFGRRQVASVWLPEPPHSTPASLRAAQLVESFGIPASPAPVGKVIRWDDLTIEVLGPRRRYASPNDQSVVLRIGRTDGPRLLLTGDIETFAQRDLTGVSAELLKVPHQGGATSDLEWLAGVGADEALISVGPNDFGHPADDVIAALSAAGARVRRTDRDGDLVVSLAGSRRERGAPIVTGQTADPP
ncbi:MAG TPA: ComEC/Rec2 family competence protein [Acidimicrobiia bacterium]|nr:ComEC/Rec2 family competence protein [Acidimicrobiia bacterium]